MHGQERECGECEACCVVMGVKEIGKFPGQECMNQTKGKGCAIYSERPESCAKFLCVWIQTAKKGAILDDRDRPDKCGVMLLASGDHSAFTKGTGIPVTICHETFPGAFRMYHGERLINKLKTKLVLVLVPYGGLGTGDRRTLVGPPLLVRKAHEWLTRQQK